MSKCELTKKLEKLCWEKFTEPRKAFGCDEVTIGWYGSERVDFLVYTTSDCFYCYEIKVTVSDFHSRNKTTFVGNLNYFVMPEDVYEKVKSEIPDEVGAYVLRGKKLVCIKRAKRQKVLAAFKRTLYGSLIRSMYREAVKALNYENKDAMLARNRELKYLREYKRDKDALLLRMEYERYVLEENNKKLQAEVDDLRKFIQQGKKMSQ